MVLNLFNKQLGLACINDCIILPFATGMSLTMSLLVFKSSINSEVANNKNYVIFPRID